MRSPLAGTVAASVVSMAWVLQTASAGMADTNEPAPGTRAFYEQRVQGRFTVRDGKLVPLTEATAPVPVPVQFGVVPSQPGVIRAPRPAAMTRPLEGLVRQVLDPATVVVETRTVLPSGAARFDRCIVTLAVRGGVVTNQELKTQAVADGLFLCSMSSGETNLCLQAWKEIPTASYDEYLTVYRAESAPTTTPVVVSYRRDSPTAPGAPGNIRTSPTPGVVPAAPQAGTREYYDRFVQGRYVLVDGTMQPMPPRPPLATETLRGRVVQVLDASNVVVALALTLASGATNEAPCMVTLDTTTGLAEGQSFSRSAVRDRTYRCVTDGGVTNIMRGYRLPLEPNPGISFEEYLHVFKTESQLKGISPVKNYEVVSGPVAPAPPPLPALSAGTVSGSLQERLRARREAVRASGVEPTMTGESLKKRLEAYQMDLIRAGGAKGPPLPMELTPEMDDQLVSEGVLPPLTESTGRSTGSPARAVPAPVPVAVPR